MGRSLSAVKNVTWDEPKDRGIGMVFQSYALYPQMTVRGNLSFALKNQRLPKSEISKKVKTASEILQIEHLLDRKPSALSGGQRNGWLLVGRWSEMWGCNYLTNRCPILMQNYARNYDWKLKRLHAKLKKYYGVCNP